MLSNFRSRVLSAACIIVLAISITVIGCGGDEGKRSDDVAVRARRDSRKPRAAAQQPDHDIVKEIVPAEIEEPVATAPEPPRAVTYEEAETAFHEKRYDEAVELFTRYTARKSENPWGYYMLGLSAWKKGDHESAEEAFERSLELDPRHVKSRLNLGRVLLDTERPEDALTQIEEALAIDPESSVAYRLKGRALHQLGKWDEAVDAYRRAITIDNEDAWSMNNMGLILIEQGKFSEALPPLARAVELRDDVATFQNNLGMALECTGHYRAAEEAYGAAVAVDDSYEKAHDNYGRIEGVAEDPGQDQVDLGAVAKSFIDEIESWSLASAGSEQPDSTEAAPDSIVVSNAVVGTADSTASGQDR
jgi:tetratricopeptide (TPR) repeat protein